MSVWSTALNTVLGRVCGSSGARMARLGLAVLLVFVASTGTVLGVRRAAADDATPHVWLHYDYLAPDLDGNTFAPNPAAIEMVVDAYARHGIMLEVDNQHNEIPYSHYIGLNHSEDCTYSYTIPTNINPITVTQPVLGVLDVKAQYFHPNANHDWHYVLFGDQISPCESDRITGEAELPGDNFIIAMHWLTFWYRHGLDVGNTAVGGTFMHELGHNLGLRHGGGDDNNYKPNYLSVMNYRFQIFGIPYAATPGSISIAGRRLDYSDAALPTLDEAHLDETLGVQGGPNDTDITFWESVDVPYAPLVGVGATSGPIDWNQDGSATDRDVKVDLDLPPGIGDCVCTPDYYIKLTGFDDWAAIRAYLDGTRDPGPKTIATDGEAEEPIVTGVSPNS
jgi:hypothetical protein